MALWLILRDLPNSVAALHFALTVPALTEQVREGMSVNFSLLSGNIFLGFLLMALRSRVATWLAPADTAVPASSNAILAGGLAVVGIYFLASGLADVLTFLAWTRRVAGFDRQLLWSGSASLFVGLVVLASSTRILRFWGRIQKVDSDAP